MKLNWKPISEMVEDDLQWVPDSDPKECAWIYVGSNVDSDQSSRIINIARKVGDGWLAFNADDQWDEVDIAKKYTHWSYMGGYEKQK